MLSSTAIHDCRTIAELGEVLLSAAQREPEEFLAQSALSTSSRDAMVRFISLDAGRGNCPTAKAMGELQNAAYELGCNFITHRMANNSSPREQFEAALKYAENIAHDAPNLFTAFVEVVRPAYHAAAADGIRGRLRYALGYYHTQRVTKEWLTAHVTRERILGYLSRNNVVIDLFYRVLAARLDDNDEDVACPSDEQVREASTVVHRFVTECCENIEVYGMPSTTSDEEGRGTFWYEPYHGLIAGKNVLPEVEACVADVVAALSTE